MPSPASARRLAALALVAPAPLTAQASNAAPARLAPAAGAAEAPIPGAVYGDVRLSTGVRLRYAAAGDASAPPMVLLHGLTDSKFSFSRVLPGLAARHRVYALDLRGHGESERPAAGYAMTDMAADVVAFLDAMGIARATVVGHSMGSFVARRVAMASPERVERLILLGSSNTPDNAVIRELKVAFRDLPDPVPDAVARDFQLSTVHVPLPDEFLATVVGESLKVPARVWRDATDGLLADGTITPATAPPVPTLLISGELDAVFGRDEQDALARAMPRARMVRYRDVGHAPHWEQPARVVGDIGAFSAEGR